MANETGAGQQEPVDSSGEYNKHRFVVEQALALISTMKIVIVKAVDTTAKTVDVQPMVNQIDGDLNSTPHGLILGIPYFNWRYGINAILANPAVDDIGLMICADRDSSTVVKTGKVSPPGSLRQLDIADGIYLGGVLNQNAPDQIIEFTSTGMELRDKNDNSLISSASGWVFTGNVVFNNSIGLDGNFTSSSGGTLAIDIHTTGTVTGDTDVVANGISGKSHKHGGVQTGGGSTIGPHN